MNRLKEFRKAAGLTQAELAEKSGVNKQMISFYEAGRNDLSKASLTTAVALATVLGVHAEELIGEAISKRPKLVEMFAPEARYDIVPQDDGSFTITMRKPEGETE